jgi:hypothetical protein
MPRKNFSYANATVTQIVEHFKTSSAQAIHLARKTWKSDEEVSGRVEEAYRLYKFSKLEEKLSVRG